MNRLFGIALTAVLVLGASPAWSILIDGNEVGGVDGIVRVTSDLNEFGPCTNNSKKKNDNGNGGNSSNPASEECWAEGVPVLDAAMVDLVFSVKTGPVTLFHDQNTNVGAFRLMDNPEYYIVKNSQTWVLMQNVDLLGWGVLDGNDARLNGFQFNFGNDTTISHVTEFNGGHDGGGEVAEPASLALLGAGIVGFGLSRRRRRGARKASA